MNNYTTVHSRSLNKTLNIQTIIDSLGTYVQFLKLSLIGAVFFSIKGRN